MRPSSSGRSIRCRRRSTARSHASSSRRWASRSTSSPRSRRSTWRPGTKGPDLQALILAAGYATRLRPLTDSVPKQLLPIGGRPMVDWILDKLRETSAEEIHLVTNARFATAFEHWAEGTGVRVHDDGTTTNDDRLGAIGDIRFVGLDDDLLAIAGDNLFDFSLGEFEAFWRRRPGSSCGAVHDVGDRELAQEYGLVESEL